MANEAKAMTGVPPYPAGPHPDGTVLVDNETTEVWFWNATANQWQRVQR